MANEKRQRLLSIVASGGGAVTLGASLSSQNQGYGDTITLNNTLVYADGTAVAVASDQYLPIIVDPGTGNAEEIWLTAAPSGSPVTAACVRGAGSSTGAPAHSSGALVVSGPTPYDRLLSIDDPWGGNLGYDYEFQGDTTSLPAPAFNGTTNTWSWLSQGTATYSEAWGRGTLYLPGQSSFSLRGITMALPSPSSFLATTKISVTYALTSQYGLAGLVLASASKALLFALEESVGPINANLQNYTSFAPGGPVSLASLGLIGSPAVLAKDYYLQIYCVSSTSWTFNVSADGINWTPVASAVNVPGSYFTPTVIGLAVDTASSSQDVSLSCQFFRVR
jgi:hypothetical protein